MAPTEHDTDTIEDTEEEVSLRDQLDTSWDETPEADDADSGDSDDDGQPRDEQGRWTKAQQEHFEEQQRQQQEAQQQDGQQQEEQLVLAAPHGWSPAAKAAYAALPPEVQESVAVREQQINRGFAKLQEFKGLEPYAEMARASGTNLREAFDRYKAAEDALEQDFIGGTVQLCEMYGIHPMQLAQTIANQFSGQQQALQQLDPQTALLARQLRDTQEAVRTLTSERQRQEQDAINGELSSFAQEALYFEDVRADMADLIRTGKADTLEEAYDKACWMHPQIRDLLIKEQIAPQNTQARVSQARRASGSLKTGAPSGSSGGGSSTSIRDALAEAWDQS